MTEKEKKAQKLENLRNKHRPMEESPLYLPGCSQIVFGEGNPDAEILFIGEAPGKQEDEQGRPFVGRSGQLLSRMLERANIKRTNAYITNIVKCRPPQNRTPTTEEIEIGKPVLNEQIAIIEPSVICTLGSTALQALLGKGFPITKVRGTTLFYQNTLLIPTYHPAYILRNQSMGKNFFEDIKKVANKA